MRTLDLRASLSAGVFEASAGGFLLKDSVLFAASYRCLADSLDAAKCAPRVRRAQLATA